MTRRSEAKGTPQPLKPVDPEDEVTRCICGNEEFVSTNRTRALNAIPGLYVQCERCNVWQHGFCMGFEAEDEIPNDYYCEKCEPQFHRIGHRHGVLQSRYRPYLSRRGAKKTSEDPQDVKHELPETPAKSIVKKQTDSPDARAEKQPDRAEPQGPAQTPEKPEKTDKPDKPESTKPEKPEIPDNQYPEEVPPEQPEPTNNASSPASSPPSPVQPASQSATPVEEESKKRSRRRESESELASFARNRKRRSREDVILQRVLEQSAREAREAEARRRSQEGLPPLDEHAVESAAESRSSVEPDEEKPKPRRSRAKQPAAAPDSPSTKDTTSSNETDAKKTNSPAPRKEPARQAARSTRNAPGSRGSRPGRRPGARSAAANGTSNSPIKRGNKRCKPRVPSQRSTFGDMRRRVAAILDFSSRTQAELVYEQNDCIGSLKSTPGSEKFRNELKHLNSVCSKNMSSLEQLTQKLLQWEEKYGM